MRISILRNVNMTMAGLATLVTLCASAAFAAPGSGADIIAVSPGGWYHLSAQFFATNAAQKLSVTLRYTDADGNSCWRQMLGEAVSSP